MRYADPAEFEKIWRGMCQLEQIAEFMSNLSICAASGRLSTEIVLEVIQIIRAHGAPPFEIHKQYAQWAYQLMSKMTQAAPAGATAH